MTVAILMLSTLIYLKKNAYHQLLLLLYSVEYEYNLYPKMSQVFRMLNPKK